MFAEVAVNFPPVRSTFHYHLPPDLEGRVGPGHLVIVSFGSRQVQGVILRLLDEAEVPETKPILERVDQQPALTPAQLTLAHWMSDAWLAPLMDCLDLMIPPGLRQRADSEYSVADGQRDEVSPAEARLLALLREHGPLRGRQLARRFPRQDWRRVADRLARRGLVVRTPVLEPPPARPKRVRTARLAVAPEGVKDGELELGRPGAQAAVRRRRMLEVLVHERAPIDVMWLYAASGGNLADLKALEQRGLVLLSEAEIWRDPLASVQYVPAEAPPLTTDQADAWRLIESHLRMDADGGSSSLLLHGVTGSGKTELYMRAVEAVLHAGRTAIVLVPEIALTAQTVRRFMARFPGEVGLIHSSLSPGERYDTWRRSRDGALKLIIGPRSALFAPLPSIGLIVVDECHDKSYKEQDAAPRYHARETAQAYATILGAMCLLGSATPDLGTYRRAERGDIALASLPQRILAHRRILQEQCSRLGLPSSFKPTQEEAAYQGMPPVSIVDMRAELREGNSGMFSRALSLALGRVLEAGQQAILFLNRRGAATHIFCRDCGWVLRCPRSATSLVYHSADSAARCHRCNYRRKMPERCASCGSGRVRQFGAGTQQVVAQVEQHFSGARVVRWDYDTAHKASQHEILMDHFVDHRADILVGTQMIAKGLDLPLVTLVGVISADTGLNLPDFRAAERTFQVLSQVAGRAGRSPLGGEVILQTYQPDHYALRAAAAHDYHAFYEIELARRKEIGYPPVEPLTRLLLKHTSSAEAQRQSVILARRVQATITSERLSATLIGPAPCFFERVAGIYRWQVLLRGRDHRKAIPQPLPQGWHVDVDPVSVL